MDDLISRAEAIDALSTPHGILYPIRTVEELPSAQPEITPEAAIEYLQTIGWMQEHDRVLSEYAQPMRKKGKWIEHNPHVKGLGIVYECSECGYEVECVSTNYCGNCGSYNGGDAE